MDDLAVPSLVAAPVRGPALDAALAWEATVTRQLPAAALEAAEAHALPLARRLLSVVAAVLAVGTGSAVGFRRLTSVGHGDGTGWLGVTKDWRRRPLESRDRS